MTPLSFHSANTDFAYQLHFHIGFRTRRCMPALRDGDRSSFLSDSLHTICQRSDYHVLEIDVSDSWVRLLVSLRPAHAPASVVQTIKANSSRSLFERFPELETEMGRRSLWSRGYYFRAVGSVTDKVILEYVAQQARHHETDRGDSRLLAAFEHPHPQQFFEFRSFSHCIAEYNCHMVFCPAHHAPAIDAAYANSRYSRWRFRDGELARLGAGGTLPRLA
jgi:putative transposase